MSEHLGEFGRAVDDYDGAAPDVFTFHGEQFEVPDALSVVVLMRFQRAVKVAQRNGIAAAERVERARVALDGFHPDEASRERAVDELATASAAEIEGQTAVMDAELTFVEKCLGEHAERFLDVAERHGVDDEELMEACARVFSAVSARPTRRRSTSSGGPSSTGDGSTDGSGSPVETPGPSRPGEASSGQVLELTPGARQKAQILADMVPVADLMRSGG